MRSTEVHAIDTLNVTFHSVLLQEERLYRRVDSRLRWRMKKIIKQNKNLSNSNNCTSIKIYYVDHSVFCNVKSRLRRYKKIYTCKSSIIWVKQAVFPVPGGPDMYKLPGFCNFVCSSINVCICRVSVSRQRRFDGMEELKTCFAFL